MPFSREEKVPFSDSGALDSVVPELFVKSLRTHVWQDPSGASVTITAQKEYEKEFRRHHGGKTVIRMAPKPRAPHMTNFIDCVRSRRAEDLNCGPDLGYQTMVAIGMSVRAYRENAVLFWDAQREEVVHRG